MNTVAADTSHSDNGFLLQPNTPDASTFSLLSEHRFFPTLWLLEEKEASPYPESKRTEGVMF
jgi:hypothetical protein